MDRSISIHESVTGATTNRRLEDLKARYVPTPNNQQQFCDGDLNKIMDRDLYRATEEGHVDEFIRALEKVSESRKLALSLIFDQVTPSGNSLLHVAASSGKEDVTELILSHYPDLVTRRNSSEDTPLHAAIQHGRLNAIEMLIRVGTEWEIIYWKNKDRKSPLYLAAETGKMEILRLLLGVYAQDEAYAVKIQGMSPVLAALNQGKQVLEEMIDRLPNLLPVHDEDGETPLHSLASGEAYWAVDLLLKKCPDLVLQTDKNGSYPIHIAFEGIASNFILSRLINCTWPDLAEIKNNKGQNIFHIAAKAGNKRAVSWMGPFHDHINEKLANSKDVDGNTPLHLAAMHNNCEALLRLTRKIRSDLGLLNNDKLTALDVAMKSESLSTKYPALLGRAILISVGAPQSKHRDVWSPKEHTEWRKDEVSTRLLVATLVATVTFAAGFTLPGGYNASSDPRPGTATMLYHRVFQIFIIANLLAMYSSILAVVILLWGHVTDFHVAEQAYLMAGPLLLTALTGMAVAFMAGVIVAVRELPWLAHLVLYISLFFLMMLIMVLAALIFPSSRITMTIVVLHYLCWTLLAGALRRVGERIKKFCTCLICCCCSPCIIGLFKYVNDNLV